MATNLINFFKRSYNRIKTRAQQEQAKDEYGDKLFADEFRPLKEAADDWGWIPSLLSVGSGSFIFLAAFPNLPWWVSVSIGLLVLSGYEKLKSIAIYWGTRLKLTGRGSVMAAIAVAIGLGSVFWSVFGTYNAYLLLESNTKAGTEALFQMKEDSIKKEYKASIDTAQAIADRFYKGNTVHAGGERVLRIAATPTYNSLVNDVRDLKKAQKDALDKIQKRGAVTVKKAVEGLGPYLYMLIAMALIVEAVIYVNGWWKQYYKWKSKTEEMIVLNQEPVQLTLEGLNNILAMMSGEGTRVIPTATHQHTKTIGFQQGPDAVHRSSHRSMNGSGKEGRQEAQCQQCGKPFVKKVAWAKYCSKDCNWLANGFTLKK